MRSSPPRLPFVEWGIAVVCLCVRGGGSAFGAQQIVLGLEPKHVFHAKHIPGDFLRLLGLKTREECARARIAFFHALSVLSALLSRNPNTNTTHKHTNTQTHGENYARATLGRDGEREKKVVVERKIKRSALPGRYPVEWLARGGESWSREGGGVVRETEREGEAMACWRAELAARLEENGIRAFGSASDVRIWYTLCRVKST